MKLYNSYIKKQTKTGEVEDIIFIQNGFSFSAFFFNILWLVYHKMIKSAVVVVVIDWALMELVSLKSSNPTDILIVLFSTSLIIATNANFWYSKCLKARGYKFAGCIFGENKEAAKLRFVEGYIDKYDDGIVRNHKFLSTKDSKEVKKKAKETKKKVKK